MTFAAGKYYQSTLKMAPPITVTWNNNDITGDGNSFSKDGVTITAGSIDFSEKNFEDNGTFTTSLGNFTKIEVVATNGFCDVSGTGWSGDSDKRTWTGRLMGFVTYQAQAGRATLTKGPGPAMPPAYRSSEIFMVMAMASSLYSPLSRRTERSPLGFCTPREVNDIVL